MIATGSRTPVIITRAGFQLICLMGRVSENKTLHRHLFQVIPSNALRQSHLVLTIFYEESRNHGEVGIGANTILIILHGTITFEGTTCLIHRIWRSTILEVILQILGEFSQHIHQVTLHGSLIHKLIVNNPFYRTGYLFYLIGVSTYRFHLFLESSRNLRSMSLSISHFRSDDSHRCSHSHTSRKYKGRTKYMFLHHFVFSYLLIITIKKYIKMRCRNYLYHFSYRFIHIVSNNWWQKYNIFLKYKRKEAFYFCL